MLTADIGHAAGLQEVGEDCSDSVVVVVVSALLIEEVAFEVRWTVLMLLLMVLLQLGALLAAVADTCGHRQCKRV